MTTFRRLAIALGLLLAAVAPASAIERIIAFISDIAVQRNGDLIVTESIRVEAEGNIIRRGIFRDLPTVYTRPDGTRAVVGFALESVARNGSSENYVIENLTNGVRVRIGHADRMVSRGQHTYVIRYRTTRQIGFFADYDELYWNVTGTDWAFPIEMAEARITVPEPVPFRQSAIYTGPQGGKGKDAAIVDQQPGRIVFRTTRPLPKGSGLTVAAAWQKGVLEPPSPARLLQNWIADNRGLVVAVLGLASMIAYYLFAWLWVGRDPPTGTVIPLFAPPDEMSPAAVRYVDQMVFDDRCLAVAIIDLGVKGHLQIVEQDDASSLRKRAGGKPLTAEEAVLASKLFSGGSHVVLSQTNHVLLGQAKSALSSSLDEHYLGKLFANNYGWSSLGLLLAVLIIATAVFLVSGGYRHVLLPTLIGVAAVGVPLFMLCAAMAYFGWQRWQRGKWRLIVGLVLVVLVAMLALAFTWIAQPGVANLVLTGALLMIGAIAGIGFSVLKAPSRSGRKTMDQIEGFREYLSVAEEDRLNLMNPPNKTPELFERFLPYAVALDCQNAWAKKFAGVLAAAGAAAATGWYVGSRDWSRDPVSVADHLGGSLAATIASSSTEPGSSSGSGGGGSSGGGGGGGGGGGW